MACATGCACCWSRASPIRVCGSGATCSRPIRRSIWSTSPSCARPEKQDGTPIRELALIAFPSRELFEVKLNEFDLVIFDRYSRRGLLPLAYLDNVARYVEDGGALLEVAGPEFAHPLSLYRTPLARVLPARPSGVVYERGFTPAADRARPRHPVTSGLLEAAQPDSADGAE